MNTKNKNATIIAEIGQNHNGDIGLACELIQEAKKSRADIAKFQLYDAKKLFPKENNPWYEYNCKTEISYKDLDKLIAECERNNIQFMASVFDIERFEWLVEYNIQDFKIASRSIQDNKLINHLLSSNKNMIISLGYWLKEHNNNPDILPNFNSKGKIDYLYCISDYPTKLTDLHLNKIDFQNKYSGFSDHTQGITAAMYAISRGAKIIEKHFTLDKTMYGPDHSCSMDPSELKILSTFNQELNLCL